MACRRFRVHSATATIAYVAIILLCGCKSNASLLTRLDPAYAPTRADPVFVTVGVHSTIQDRQMLPLIKRELQAEGFNLTDFNSSKWVVVVGRDDRTIITGTTSDSVGIGIANSSIIGIPGVSRTTTHEETEKVGEIVLSLVTKESTVRGDPIEVWQGKITTDPENIKETPRTVIRTLIDQYGKNFEEDIRLPGNKENTY
jgi:hypothetical protein